MDCCMTQILYFAKQFSLSGLAHLLGGLKDIGKGEAAIIFTHETTKDQNQLLL